ncbi:glycosyltransferase family 2 protein [Hymenobacter sp. 102]|uniref:glycosyltransferase family 2 protein n=1 Tax=Hymenobacter sp. 102 TaxID=3403152 RepID=UPI003CEF971C
MENSPLVSFGVASYNNSKYVLQTLNSIKNQTYKNFEIVIVDDCSVDNSIDVINNWIKNNYNLKVSLVCNKRNNGICKVWNQLVLASNGEYISIIASDDYYYPDKLAVQVPILNSMPDIGMVTSPVSYVSEVGDIIEEKVYGAFCDYLNTSTKEEAYIEMLKMNYVSTMGTLIRKKCFDKVGLYDETLAYEDWDMWIRIAKQFKIWFSPIVSAAYRRHDKSISSTRAIQLMESTIQLLNKQRGNDDNVNKIIVNHTKEMSEFLYVNNSVHAKKWLKVRMSDLRDIRSVMLYTLSFLGVKGNVIQKTRAKLAKLKA